MAKKGQGPKVTGNNSKRGVRSENVENVIRKELARDDS